METTVKTMTTFGVFLHSKRKESLYTVREFARELGIRPSELCDYEYDRALPSDSRLLGKMSDLLELSSDDNHKLYELAGKLVQIDETSYVQREYESFSVN